GVVLGAALLVLPALRARAAAAPQSPSPAPAAASTVAPPVQPLAFDSDQQKTLYALGLALSQSLSRLGLQRSQLDYVVQGLQDGALGRDPRVKLEDYEGKVQELAAARLEVAGEREEAQARAFLSRMAARPGAVKTDSGIVIIAQQEGSGRSPKESDTVR